MATAAESSAKPDVQQLAHYARSELAEILGQDDKDVVIQHELMSLLNHIANVKFLRSLNVKNFYRLEPRMKGSGYQRYYIIRPEIRSTSMVANHITQNKKDGIIMVYHVIFVPRKLACCDLILEREGVCGLTNIHEWNLYLIPLDEHILSLEVPEATQALYIHGDYTLLHSVAQSVLQLETMYGSIKVFQSKGQLSKNIWELLCRLKEVYKLKDESWSSPEISELIMVDRSVDLVTPLCSQMTYEGMLDDVLRIRNGFIEVKKDMIGKTVDTKVLVNSTDPVYKLIRGKLFSDIPSELSRLSRELKGEYTKGKEAQKIDELKSFVTELPELKKKHGSLSTHLQVSEKVVIEKKRDDFTRQLTYERAILEGQDIGVIVEYIEECIQRQVTSLFPIRLMCLLSLTSGGIKSKYYQSLKLQYLQSYGYNQLSTFYSLEQLGLLRERTGELATYPSSFRQLNKALKLIPKYASLEDMEQAKDMSCVFGGAYVPLSCAAVKSVIENGCWQVMDEIKIWKGPSFSHGATPQPLLKKKESKGNLSSQSGRVIVVYFVGGCTFSEINALQLLGEKMQCKIIVATTNLINATTLLESLVKSN